MMILDYKTDTTDVNQSIELEQMMMQEIQFNDIRYTPTTYKFVCKL